MDGRSGGGARAYLSARHMAAGLATCTLLTLASAVWPPSAATPVAVWYAASAVLAVMTGGVLAARRLRRTPVVALVLAVLVAGALVATCRTLAGVVTTALGLVCAGQAAGLVGSGRTVRRVLELVVVVLAVGMLVSPVPFRPVTWLVLTAATLVTSSLVAYLVARLRRVAATDDLTGALNRGAFDDAVGDLLTSARRHDRPVSVVCVDVDDFKVVNDTRGHQAGDEVLVALVRAWRAGLGRRDAIGRVGGDEFVVVLDGRTGAQSEVWVEEARDRLPAGAPSWSHGVAEARPGESIRELLARADDALYARKGRRVATA